MRVVINGEEKEVKEGILLSALLRELGIACDRVAVERNRLIVPPADYEETRLEEGDRLEIVSFVGGG